MSKKNEKIISIKELRTMSQEEFAKEINVSVKDIQNWEAGNPIFNEFELAIRSTLLKYPHDTTKGRCILGWNLLNLKRSEYWKRSFNQATTSPQERFQKYCECTFGFSYTHTSNLLRLAKYVSFSGNNVEFIDPIYAQYNTSQLIELSSINLDQHKYFNPNMTVKEIRDSKRYLKYGSFHTDKLNPHFDLLLSTRAWETKNSQN